MQLATSRVRHPELPSAGAAWWLPELDGLRAVACLAVVVHHTAGHWFEGIALANLGVGLFFCLSGLLIYVLAVREQTQHGSISLRRFYCRRILRIWPLYFAVLGVGTIIALLSTGPDIAYLYAILFVLNLGIAFNYVGSHRFQVPDSLGVTWSIAVEEQFYAVFPFVFAIMMRADIARIRVILLALVASFGARMAFVSLPLDHPDLPQIGTQAGLYYFTLSYVDLFLLGAVAGEIYLRRGALGIESPRTMTALFVAAVAACGLLALWWAPALWPPYQWHSALIYTLIAVALSCLIYAVIANPTALYARMLRLYPLRVLGLLSYGIYLVHVPAVFVGKLRFPAADPSVLPLAQGTVTIVYVLALATAVAAGLHVLIERPFLRLKTQRSAQASGLTSTTVPWRRCMLLALGVIVAIEALSRAWPPLQ